MRNIPKTFTGFICGTWVAPFGDVTQGVMEFSGGYPIALHVPRRGVTLNKLYTALRKAPYVDESIRERVELVRY